MAEQENTIAALHEKIKQKEAENFKLQASLQVSNNNLKSEQNRYVSRANAYVKCINISVSVI